MSDKPTGAAMVRVIETRAIEPANMGELRMLAECAATARLFQGLTPEQALITMMAGRDMGFSYAQSLRAFQIVKGKPALSADAMVAVCLSRPEYCEYFRPVRVTEKEAVWVTKRVGAEPIEGSFTIDDAKKADLLGDMYRKYPKRMLSARAKAFLARDVYPELLMGIYSPEEIKAGAATEDDIVDEPEPDFEPTPAPRLEPPPTDYDARADYFVALLAEASLDGLERVAAQIKTEMAGGTSKQRVRLVKAFSERKAQLTETKAAS